MKNLSALLLLILWITPILAQSGQTPRPLVLTHVTVIDMTGAPPKLGMAVVIAGDRIARISKDGELPLPPDALVVDATGKFLIPGLWDMHVHTVYGQAGDTERTFFPLLLANGIIGVRNLGSIHPIDQIDKWRRQTAAGRIAAPRMVIGQQLDGPGGDDAPFVYRVKTAAEARAAVQRIKREGFDFVKVYSRLSRESFFATADEAKRQGLPFAGHVSDAVNDGEASDAGQGSIEHLEGMLISSSADETRIRTEWLAYDAKLLALKGKPATAAVEDENFRLVTQSLDTFSETKAAEMYAQFVRNGTYHCPTLVIHRAWGSLGDPAFFQDARLRYVPARQRAEVNSYLNAARDWSTERKSITARLFQFRLRMIRDMNRAGVELLAGTDTAYGYPVAGFALHDELALLVQGGIDPLEALRTATYNPAKYLGQLGSRGTVELGKIADLVLLDADPLKDIGNTAKINAVFLNGRYFPKEELTRMLAQIETLAK